VEACAGDFTTNFATPSSALPNWPSANVYDGNTASAWSSVSHPTSAATESIAFWWTQGMQATNYVKLMPRYSGNNALSFPVSFTVNYSNGSQWVQAAVYNNFPTPDQADWIILPLPTTVNCNGIQIVATTLGTDGSSYYFQLAEARAGYGSATGPLVVAEFSGNSYGDKLVNALSAVPAGGAIVDARDCTGSQSVSQPLAIGAAGKPTSLVLGPCTLLVSATVTVGLSSSIVGMPQGMQTGYPNTTMIEAAPGAALMVVVHITPGSALAALRDLTIDGNSTGGGTPSNPAVALVEVDNATRVDISNLTVQNSGGMAVLITGANPNDSDGAKISKLMTINNASSGLVVNNTNDIFVTQSEFEGHTTGNTTMLAGSAGINLNNASAFRITNSDISGNYYGIHMANGSSVNNVSGTQFAANQSHDILVEGWSRGNIFSGNMFLGGNRLAANSCSMQIRNSYGNTVVANQFMVGPADFAGVQFVADTGVNYDPRSVFASNTVTGNAFLGSKAPGGAISVSNPSLPGLVTAGNADATGL
jgi:hypothetical protein